MAKEYIRLNVDAAITRLFLQEPFEFLQKCDNDRDSLFLCEYRKAYPSGGFRLFRKKPPVYTSAQFPVYKRSGPNGERLICVFQPEPEEKDLPMYNMAYGVSCRSLYGGVWDIQLHIVRHNMLGQPSVLRIEDLNGAINSIVVLVAGEDLQSRTDMLWRAAFGNQVDPVEDTEELIDRNGQLQVFTRRNPACTKIAEDPKPEEYADISARDVYYDGWETAPDHENQ